MKGDPAVDDELDAFSLVLPLPFRVALIIVLGVWAWGANLHYLTLIKIDVPALIRYPSRSSSRHPPHHLSTYRLASVLSVPLASALVLFWLFTHGNAKEVARWELLPNLYLLVMVVIFFLPLHMFSRSGRSRFLTTLRRISIGGLAEAHDGKFGDILMADALTSYAKVLGDLFISLCMFFSSGRSSTGKPDRLCGGQFFVPLIISIPSMIRLRQCLIEYGRVRKASREAPRGLGGINQGWGGQHLANALKYSSAFPVIILSALQRGYDPEKMGMSEKGLFRLWLFFVCVNSFYSFYWDVAKDWDLSLFSSDRDNPEHPWGLRRHRYFHNDNMYYTVIVLDLVLRCTWSLKLSSHLDHWNDVEGGIFAMEALEVFRRWVWIFFRVETEWGESDGFKMG
ncbi:EXS-domain-containing protein [Eremomyces bilateralis CBS 781.70]|uniref:EXS-domain-containing protein n=1 Tax=Eremomyces bilateralis CBS 781.70 TaxID=1392243 RepID=A0A6G1GD89_9PEZI|nr:EXS-domain-containing protein [Eremomyces bilateralis CBS 781.70]KAF1815861.1 EXS-domain-containing protein [Eremomyces bilateralis CBS 781.70]